MWWNRNGACPTFPWNQQVPRWPQADVQHAATGIAGLASASWAARSTPSTSGQLVAATEASWVYDLDEVIFVPTGRPVFKLDKNVTNAEDRYLMTVIATASNPKFTVSRVDIDRPGVTYTIDTLRDIRAQHPDAELFFITGADAVAEIMQWKDADKMWDLAHFVAVTRPGYSSPEGVKLPEGKVDTLEIPALAISSTDVRRRAEHGEPVWYLVPDGVVQYIGKHGLYR